VSDAELRDLIEELDEAAARLVEWHRKWFFGEVLPTIRRTNKYEGGVAAQALAQIDAPSIADTIQEAAAYLRKLREERLP
jgi:prophage antirepressor-like protein